MSNENLEIEGGVIREEDNPENENVNDELKESDSNSVVEDEANELENEDPVSKTKIKPSLFSTEELNERNRKRLKMGKCCLKESWELYDKLVDTLKTKKKIKEALENDDCRNSSTQNPIEVCVDKTLIFRLKGLKNMYKLFQQTIELAKEAPFPPFLRISQPQTLDKKGAKDGLIGINKTQKPEITNRDDPPRTIAFLGKILHVTNTNFILREEIKHFEDKITQTTSSSEEASTPTSTLAKGPSSGTTVNPDGPSSGTTENPDGPSSGTTVNPDGPSSGTTVNPDGPESVLKLSKWSQTSTKEVTPRLTVGLVKSDLSRTSINSSLSKSKDKLISFSKDAIDDEAFEITDIPIDADGNPIGKTTGYCCYCGKEIRPIPTPYELSMCVNSALFYCCKKYKDLIDHTKAFEKKLQDEDEKKNTKIDISPHKKYDPNAQRLIFGRFGSDILDGQGDGAMRDKNKKLSTGSYNEIKDTDRRLSTDGEKVEVNYNGEGDSDKQKQKRDNKKIENLKNQKAEKVKGRRDQDTKRQTQKTEKAKAQKIQEAKKQGQKTEKIQERKGQRATKHHDIGNKEGNVEKRISAQFKDIPTTSIDLPWDPYVEHFKHGQYFNTQVFDDADRHCYKHPYVVLEQAELYDNSSGALGMTPRRETKTKPLKQVSQKIIQIKSNVSVDSEEPTITSKRKKPSSQSESKIYRSRSRQVINANLTHSYVDDSK